MLLSHPECGFANGWSVGFGEQRYLWPRGFESGKAFLRENFVTGRALVRKTAHTAAGGYDETILDGFEDWDFWLRCASKGCWGTTIPEYLDWYRRREHHGDRWREWSTEERVAVFRERLRENYGKLLDHRFPSVRHDDGTLRCPVDGAIPFDNVLRKPRPRVLLVLPWLAMGGSDKFNLDLVERLVSRGYDISIATTLESDNTWAPEFTRFTADVFHLPNFLNSSDHPRFLAYLIASRRPDAVVISHSELGYLLLPYLRARCPEPAYLDYCHIENEDWKSGGYPRLSVAMQSSLDVALVSSQHLKGWMVERGADPNRVEVIHTNVDTDKWHQNDTARVRLRAEWEIRDDAPLILFAARLCEQKQPHILVGVFAELDRRGVPFRAVIAGDGELREPVETSLRLNRLTDRVRLIGSVRTAEMRDVMSACDLFLLPSRWEGIALSIFEAMAMGLVVVGADVGGQRELVTPECGILIPIADEETQIKAYADALTTLLRDDETRHAMGRRARERVRESFDLGRMVDGLTGALDRALHAPGRRTRGRLPADLAHEWAEQAVDYVRLTRLADSLWLERDRLRARLAGSGVGASTELVPRLLAEQRIANIEASRSWRMVQRVRRSLLYRIWRRLRLGPGWDVEPPSMDSQLRLARVESSRGFRLIQALKRNPAYGWYARRRWPDWEHPS
jgi:glycosyltransferase involved in cell wall biosynthesis